MAGNRKGKHDIAPIIRAGLENGIKELVRREGKVFSAIVADWLQDNPIAVLNAVSKYNIRESKVSGSVKYNHEHKAVSGETDSLIEQLIQIGTNRDDAEVSEDGSVLPAETCTKPTRH